MNSLNRRTRFSVARLAGIIVASIMILVGASCSNQEREQVLEMKHKTEALKIEMTGNIRQGLAGLGIKDGAPFLGNNSDIQRFWGAALKQADELAPLIPQIRTHDPAFKMEFEVGWTQGMLENGLKARAQLDDIFKNHPVMNEHEAHVAWSFMYAAHSLAEDVGQPDPFPNYAVKAP